jgi:hypothetical protein
MAKKQPKEPFHEFHAKAHLLEGKLIHPVKRTIKPHSEVLLHGLKGGHRARAAQNINIDGLIHVRKGHTRVSGGGTLKHKGWITLATAVLEGLNVFEVVAADRIVSQASTEHAWEKGHTPSVTFIGSHFDNLRINGVPLELTLNLDICGKKPDDDQSYLVEQSFLKTARAQVEKVAHASALPKKLEDEYAKKLAFVDTLIGGGKSNSEPGVTCSLVQSINNIGEIPIPGIRAIGHVLVIPEFGWVSLGEITVGERMYTRFPRPSVFFELQMLRIHLGCIGGGTVSSGTTATNGGHKP